MKLKAGENFPPLHVRNVHGTNVSVPNADALVHLQFRRFAGCPVCNLHLRTFIQRHKEVIEGGVREIVVFHSSNGELLPYQGQFPFDVIGDPERKLYRQYGVETAISAILNPGTWPALLKGSLAKNKPKIPMIPNGGILGLPAEFLVDSQGIIKAAHYGRHAGDSWSVDEMLQLARVSGG
jgi:peroxiredoxin